MISSRAVMLQYFSKIQSYKILKYFQSWSEVEYAVPQFLCLMPVLRKASFLSRWHDTSPMDLNIAQDFQGKLQYNSQWILFPNQDKISYTYCTYQASKQDKKLLIPTRIQINDIPNLKSHVSFESSVNIKQHRCNLGQLFSPELWTGLSIWEMLISVCKVQTKHNPLDSVPQVCK